MWSQDRILRNNDLGIKCYLINLQSLSQFGTSLLSCMEFLYFPSLNTLQSSHCELPQTHLGLSELLCSPCLCCFCCSEPLSRWLLLPNNFVTWPTVLSFCVICIKYSWTHSPKPESISPSSVFHSLCFLQHIHTVLSFSCLFAHLSSFIDYKPFEVRDVILFILYL